MSDFNPTEWAARKAAVADALNGTTHEILVAALERIAALEQRIAALESGVSTVTLRVKPISLGVKSITLPPGTYSYVEGGFVRLDDTETPAKRPTPFWGGRPVRDDAAFVQDGEDKHE